MVMRSRIGVALRGDHAAAVHMRRGRVLAEVARERQPDQEWSPFLSELIAEIRGAARLTPMLAVAVDDRRCRTVVLFGESATSTNDAVRDRFAANPLEFVVGGGEALVAGKAWRDAFGWRGVALAAPLAEAVRTAARASRCTLAAIAPSPTHASGEALEEVAVAAVGLEADDPTSIDLLGPERAARAVRRRRIAMTAGIVLALGWAAIAPAVGAYRAAVRLEEEAAEARAELAAMRARTPSDPEGAALSERVARVRADRGRASALLSGISQVLPDSSAIVFFRMEGEGGTLTIVAPQVAGTITALTKVPELKEARVSGAIVRETHGTSEVQRATLTWMEEEP